MKSAANDVLPSRVRRTLVTLGADIAIARRKRMLTAATMTERVGVSKATYQRIEKGDPTVSMGAYAMTLFVLGFSDAFKEIADVRRDDMGLLLDVDRLPKRVRVKRVPTAW